MCVAKQEASYSKREQAEYSGAGSQLADGTQAVPDVPQDSPLVPAQLFKSPAEGLGTPQPPASTAEERQALAPEQLTIDLAAAAKYEATQVRFTAVLRLVWCIDDLVI